MDTKLYSNSDNTSNYKKFNRTLTGKNKSSSLSVEKVNTALIEHAKVEFEEEDHLYLMHDPSDLRKKHSNKTENIGEVRDLSGNIINGFYTFNTIALSTGVLTKRFLEQKIFYPLELIFENFIDYY